MTQTVGYGEVKPDIECIDILTQLIAVKAALEQVGVIMFREHTKQCVADAVFAGDPNEKIRELSDCVGRFVRA